MDTATTMRGGLVHDCLFQLMREKLLGVEWRHTVDNELRRILLEDGVCRFRAWYFLKAVRMFGETSADPAHTKPILEAP